MVTILLTTLATSTLAPSTVSHLVGLPMACAPKLAGLVPKPIHAPSSRMYLATANNVVVCRSQRLAILKLARSIACSLTSMLGIMSALSSVVVVSRSESGLSSP